MGCRCRCRWGLIPGRSCTIRAVPGQKKLSEEEAKANRSYNEAQLARLCVLAGEYEREIVALSVGNENTPDWGGDILAQERLVEFALRVRESCRQPVTYNEGAPQWKELRALGENS